MTAKHIGDSTSVLLQNLRNVMKRVKDPFISKPAEPDFITIQAYIIPSCDEHQSEYISSCDKRIAFMSGFTGSAGTAIVTKDLAALWTDGRYFLQAQQQLDANWTLMEDGMPGTPTQGDWLSEVLPPHSNVGIDPFLISFVSWKILSRKLESEGHTLLPLNYNLVDIIWKNKPHRPHKPIEILPIEYTGKPWQEKVKDVLEDLKKHKVSALVITALDEIAWLFNLRGSDIEFNPVFFAYSIITLDSIYLFIDEDKLSAAIKRELYCNNFENDFKLIIHPYKAIKEILNTLIDNESKVWISNKSSYALASMVKKAWRISQPTPLVLMKAVKNESEIQCMRNAHVKDAVALCEFFAWLEDNISGGDITELSAASKLEEFRKLQKEFVGPSFATISATGPNGAIIHYKPTLKTDRRLTVNEVYLCDSGGQYRDGTTDVTRTWHFGTPSDYEKECYTRVMQGHIALSSAVFPRLIKGQMLDTLARKALWDAGLDYLHGTGHGVGVYLNVHEGPISISWKPYPDDPGLQEGMISSIEPGYYEEDQFGIRIENLVVIKTAKTKHTSTRKTFLAFEPLTLVPFQSKLLDPAMLSAEEVLWINDYNSKCQEIIGEALKEQGKKRALVWLYKETMPLG